MWLPLPLTLTFLLVADSRQMASEVGITQLAAADCLPPNLAVGGQCLLVDTDTSEGCTSPFVAVGDQCLNFATFAKVTQVEAKQLCHTLHSELVTVDTATRHKNIIDHINNNGLGGDFYWIDGSDADTEGTWQFSSGQPIPMGTPFWQSWDGARQPDNSGDAENCLELRADRSYYFNDIPCSFAYTPICEQPSQVNSSALRPQLRTDCPTFYLGVGSKCLSFVTWAEETWADAQQTCVGMGGDLAAVTDIEDLRAIYSYIHSDGIAGHSFWLGGSDAATEGVWTWIDNTPVPMGAPFWGNEKDEDIIEPQGGTGENCLMLHANGYHYFRDSGCDILMNALCQLTE